MIREVILVDDGSDMEHLGKELEQYLIDNFDGKMKIRQ